MMWWAMGFALGVALLAECVIERRVYDAMLDLTPGSLVTKIEVNPPAVRFVQAPSMFHVAATKPRAALWVHLVCGEADIYDTRRGEKAEPVRDAIAQFELVYEETPFGCLN